MSRVGRRLGISSLIKAAKKACRAVDIFGPVARRFVPTDKLAAFDAALAAIQAGCAALRQIEYTDGEAGTSAPWAGGAN